MYSHSKLNEPASFRYANLNLQLRRLFLHSQSEKLGRAMIPCADGLWLELKQGHDILFHANSLNIVTSINCCHGCLFPYLYKHTYTPTQIFCVCLYTYNIFLSHLCCHTVLPSEGTMGKFMLSSTSLRPGPCMPTLGSEV